MLPPLKQTARKVVQLGWGTLNINNRWHCITGGLSIVTKLFLITATINGIGGVKEPIIILIRTTFWNKLKFNITNKSQKINIIVLNYLINSI